MDILNLTGVIIVPTSTICVPIAKSVVASRARRGLVARHGFERLAAHREGSIVRLEQLDVSEKCNDGMNESIEKNSVRLLFEKKII